MIPLARLLLSSGALLPLGAWMVRKLSRYSDTQLLQRGAIALAAGWAITIADSFLPVMATPPLGLVAFLLAAALSVTANVIAFVLAATVVYRRAQVRPGDSSHGSRVGLAVLTGSLAIVSFIGERVVSLVAAVH